MTDSLAIRRQELLVRCAAQRVDLALEVHALRAPGTAARPLAASAAGLLAAKLLANKRLALGVAGAGLGLLLIRPARLMRVTRLAAAGWRAARQGLALVAHLRG